MTTAQPPFFVIRNSIHASFENDLVASSAGEGVQEEDDEESFREEYRLPSNVPIVHLVETSTGSYELDFHDSFLASFLSAEEETPSFQTSAANKTYIDGRVWKHLCAFAELVGKPIADDRNGELSTQSQKICLRTALDSHEGEFILMDDAVKEVARTLLSIQRLLGWQVLINARSQGYLQWKDIRSLLALVRSGVPFITPDGLLKHAYTCLTCTQFIAFARLIESHIASASSTSPVVAAAVEINIDDVFPSFHELTDEDREIELLASIKDKAVRTGAQVAGLTIPTNLASLDCDEWQPFVQWWGKSDEVRNGFCLRELLFAEKDVDVRRDAQKNGVSLRGRHSEDPSLREGYLRRFGLWYYGTQSEEGEDGSTVGGNLAQQCKAAVIYTHEFSTGLGDFVHASPPKTTSFRNKSWRPSSAVDREEEFADESDHGGTLLSDLMTIESARGVATSRRRPGIDSTLAQGGEEEERSPQTPEGEPVAIESAYGDATSPSDTPDDDMREEKPSQPSELNKTTPVTSVAVCENEPTPFEKIAATLILEKARVKQHSNRRRFLRRITSDMDRAQTFLNNKAAGPFRGIELFRSKVRLLIMLQKFLGLSANQLESIAPASCDIFHVSIRSPKPPPPKPKTVEPPKTNKSDAGAYKALLDKAKTYHQFSLQRAFFRKMVAWTQHRLLEKEREEEERQRASLEKQRMQMLTERAIAAYQRSVTSRFFRAFRDNVEHQKAERAKIETVPPQEEIEEVEEPTFVPPPTSAEKERKLFALEDERSQKWKSFSVPTLPPFFGDECMELIVGRSRPSGLDTVCLDEYNERFAMGIELNRSESSPVPAQTGIDLVDENTLQRMKLEKLAGASNLFDVPDEFVYPQSPDDGIDAVEYRTKEMVEGIVGRK